MEPEQDYEKTRLASLRKGAAARIDKFRNYLAEVYAAEVRHSPEVSAAITRLEALTRTRIVDGYPDKTSKN